MDTLQPQPAPASEKRLVVLWVTSIIVLAGVLVTVGVYFFINSDYARQLFENINGSGQNANVNQNAPATTNTNTVSQNNNTSANTNSGPLIINAATSTNTNPNTNVSYPPIEVTNVSITITDGMATARWTTNTPTGGWVNYGVSYVTQYLEYVDDYSTNSAVSFPVRSDTLYKYSIVPCILYADGNSTCAPQPEGSFRTE